MIPFKKLPFSLEQVHVVSDIHAYHKGICKGTSEWIGKSTRNFDTIESMNKALLNGINNNVGEDDLLISHGDWSFGGEDKIELFRNEIKCKNIIYIRGNHCQHAHKHPELFMEILDIGYFQVDGIKFVSCHYPIFHWHFQEHGSLMLHGHLHGHEDAILEEMHRNYKIMDVGVDCAYRMFDEYRPFKLSEVVKLLRNKYTKHRHDDI